MAEEKKQTKRAAPTAAAPKEKKAKVETAPTRRSARSVSVSVPEPAPKVSKPAAKAKAEPKVEAKKVEPKPKAEPKAKAGPKKTEKKAEPKVAKKESPKKAAAAPKAKAEPKPKAETKPKAEKVEKKADPKPKEAKKAEPKVAKKATDSPKKKAEPKPAAKETKSPKKASAPKAEAKTSPKKSSAMDASPKKVSLSKVTEGQPLPTGFTIKANDESMIDLNELSKTTGFVIFFYPKANTPGCTKQACGFRDNYQQIVKAGYQVFGMSADSPNAQTNWKVKNDFPYLLLCDQDGKHLKQFGVFKEPKSVTRSHVIVSKGGVVSQLKIQISPLDSVNEALAFVLKK